MAHELGASTKLAVHVGRLGRGVWDDAVLQRTKTCLLDSLACYSAGLSSPHFQQSVAAAKDSFGADRSLPQLSPFLMAYIYGQAANALDYDDMLHGHPGSPVVGAVLAAAVSKNLATDQLLRGIVAGYEAHGILCAASLPSKPSPVRSIGVFDTVAAAVGVSVALGLDDHMIERVIGVAVAHSILPYTGKWYERPVPAMKNNMGWIAGGALLSVNLAVRGQTGVTMPLDGEGGMWRMAGSDSWAIDEHLSGQPVVLGVGFKPYPGCWHTQEFLKTFSNLLQNLQPGDEVAEIVVAGPADTEKFCQKDLIGTADFAFSLPALFGLIISGQEPGPLWEHFDDAQIRYDFRYESSSVRTIRIRTRNRYELTGSVEPSYVSSLAGIGLDDAGVVSKFKRLVDINLQSEVLRSLTKDRSSAADDIPKGFYHCMEQSMVKALGA